MKMHRYVYLSLIFINLMMSSSRAMENVVIRDDYDASSRSEPSIEIEYEGGNGSERMYFVNENFLERLLDSGNIQDTLLILKAAKYVASDVAEKHNQEDLEKLGDELTIKKAEKERQRLHQESTIADFLRAILKIKEELGKIEIQITDFEEKTKAFEKEIAVYDQQEKKAGEDLERNERLQKPLLLVETEAVRKETLEEQKVSAKRNKEALEKSIITYKKQVEIQTTLLGKLIAQCASHTAIKKKLDECLFKCNEGLGRLGIAFPGAVATEVAVAAIRDYNETAEKLPKDELDLAGLGVGTHRKMHLKKKKKGWFK